jgi:hypothetical protein
MSIARTCSRVVRQQLRAHIAWLPLANNFELGDFGVFTRGVFTRIGNVRSLGARFGARRSEAAPFEFRSAGTTEVCVSAGFEVPAFSTADVDARLRVGFSDASSLYVRTGALEVSEIDELLPVAAAVRAHPQWRMRYRVIHRLWTARDAIFVTSESSGAQIELAGAVAALRGVQAGRGAVDVQVAHRSGVGLDLVGHTGPLALGLFRVRVIDGSPAMLDFATADAPYELDEPTDDEPTDDL